jgi:hypothetical protein
VLLDAALTPKDFVEGNIIACEPNAPKDNPSKVKPYHFTELSLNLTSLANTRWSKVRTRNGKYLQGGL